MGETTLDIALTQDLQRAVGNGRRIAEVIARLRRTSLAGIMEYGCLRWAHPANFPILPRAVIESPLGRALNEVRSDLGLRQSGPQKMPPRDTDPREVEFYVVAEEDDLVKNDYFRLYLVRFESSATRIGIPKRTATALQAAFEEMATNVVNHAKAPVASLIGYEVRGHVAQFCVVDVGRGVLESLRENPAFGDTTVHSDAIKMALHTGVSRVVGQNRRGFGFNTVFKALTEQWGQLRFRSGEGVITMNGMGLDADQGQERDLPYLSGFQVAVACRSSAPAQP